MKPPTKPFVPDDADLAPGRARTSSTSGRACAHPRRAAGGDLVAPAAVQVVVPEHGADRDAQARAGSPRAPRPAPARRASSGHRRAGRGRLVLERREGLARCRSRVASEAWTSPAAAIVTMSQCSTSGRKGNRPPMADQDQEFEQLLDAMKKAARGAARGRRSRSSSGGGLACWARGAPKTEHDVDFLVRPAGRGARTARRSPGAGMRTETPPEGWLLKAYDDETC